jgi:hypothetical protein
MKSLTGVIFLVIEIVVKPQPSDSMTAFISGPEDDTKCTPKPFSCMYLICPFNSL